MKWLKIISVILIREKLNNLEDQHFFKSIKKIEIIGKTIISKIKTGKYRKVILRRNRTYCFLLEKNIQMVIDQLLDTRHLLVDKIFQTKTTIKLLYTCKFYLQRFHQGFREIITIKQGSFLILAVQWKVLTLKIYPKYYILNKKFLPHERKVTWVQPKSFLLESKWYDGNTLAF